MIIPLEFYEQIRGVVRVSDVVRLRLILTKKGGEYLGICPFHDEKTPSFTVNDAKRFYHCFGCSAHGDAIRFVAETSGISYKEAAIKIAGDHGIDLPKMSAAQEKRYEEADQIYNILELASQFFISKRNSDIINYLTKRGLTLETIEKFSIGYATKGEELVRFFESKSFQLKDLLKSGLVGVRDDGKIYEVFNNRVMFPIKNIYNKIVGFGGRSISDAMPKYINSPETIIFKKGETMYGENFAREFAYKDNYSIIVEGYMDVITLHQAGFKHAVASLGTAVTEKHIEKLWRSADEIIACLDGDNAGVRASSKLINMAMPHISTNKSMSFITLPTGLDPDDLIKASGSQAFDSLLKNRLGLSEMIWRAEYAGKNFKTAESMATLEQKLDEYCNNIADRSLKANFKRYFKDMIWQNLIRRKSTGNNRAIISEKITSAKKYSEIEVLEQAICAFMIKYPKIMHETDLRDVLYDLELKDQTLNEFKNWLLETVEENTSALDNNQQFPPRHPEEAVGRRKDPDPEKQRRSKNNIKLDPYVALRAPLDDERELLDNNVKNTRFYDTYLVLSNPDMLFLDLTFLNKAPHEQKQVFQWLCKKHYLILLKQEYLDVLSKDVYNSQSKSASYLEEIQRISKELTQLNESFINN